MRVFLITLACCFVAAIFIACPKTPPAEDEGALPTSTGIGDKAPAEPGTVQTPIAPAGEQGPLAPGAETPTAQKRDTATLPTDTVVGKQLPTFEVTLLDGSKRSIEDFIGKPLMVNFWGINCPPCKAELPELVKFYDKYKPQGLEIVSLNTDSTPAEQIEFMKAQPMPWITASDVEGLFKKWGNKGIPTTYFVDPTGVILEIHKGGMNMDYMEQMKAKLFGEAAPGPVAPANPAGPTG
jgi:thiol-disulfide isomerase/thioredoxin